MLVKIEFFKRFRVDSDSDSDSVPTLATPTLVESQGLCDSDSTWESVQKRRAGISEYIRKGKKRTYAKKN